MMFDERMRVEILRHSDASEAELAVTIAG